MNHNLTKLHGYTLAATDGDIGYVKDFFFDDHSWAVRYLVVDTGSWLTGRLVLISPHAFGAIDDKDKSITVRLSKNQIELSPSIDAGNPVSRRFETDYYTYYGYPTYWSGGGLWGMSGTPSLIPVSAQFDDRMDFVHPNDADLRSAKAVTDFHIEALDGPLGHVADFMVDDRSWAISEIVVEAGHWYSGKEVLISPSEVDRISYEESKVFVRVSKDDIMKTSEHGVVHAGG
jgi:hypothetical protein